MSALSSSGSPPGHLPRTSDMPKISLRSLVRAAAVQPRFVDGRRFVIVTRPASTKPRALSALVALCRSIAVGKVTA